jgi:peptidoglycan/LPS O-acetylase OafA/YrhL
LSLVFVVVVLLAAQADLSDRPGILTSRAAVWAGEISFAFYLVHELVLLNLPPVTTLTGVPLALACFVLSVLLAAALHVLVERPTRRLLLAVRLPRAGVPG